MRSRIWIPVLLIAAAIAVVGCEEKTKYIVADDETIPATPVGVYSVTGDGYVDIYWPLNNDGGVTDDYAVYYYVRTEGNQDVYELLANGNDIEYLNPNEDRDQALGHFRDSDVSNGVTYWYAVSAYNENGESDLSFLDAEDTPRPQGDRTVDLSGEDLNRLGWDFSAARTRVWSSVDADVFFEYDSQLDAFFLWSNRDDVYLQDYGFTDSLKSVNWGEPGGGWDNVGWVQLSSGHAYVVGIGDVDEPTDLSENYGVVRVTSLDYGAEKVGFEWAYQTDTFNPELKRTPTTGEIPSAIRYYRRSGN